MLFEPFLQLLPVEIVPRVISYPTNRHCSAHELLGIVLSQLPNRHPYVLLAESFSGPIALKASSLHSTPPKALILCASFAMCPLPRLLIIMLWILGKAFVQRRIPRWLVRYYLLGQAPDEIISLFYSAVSIVAPCVLARRIRVLAEFDSEYSPALKKVPILYLKAAQDRIVGSRHLCLIQRRYPTVKVIEIASPHLMLQSQPDPSMHAILNFIKMNSTSQS